MKRIKTKKSGKPSPAKAKEMLHDGTAHGRPLTDAQRRYFGHLANAEAGIGIVDPRGQWAHPGQVTTIPSNEITMQGISYPVLGISNTGQQQMMLPGQDYIFDGSQVTEYPMKKKLRKAQNGTGLSGPVLRSGPDVKNSLPPVATVTEAPNPYAANRGFRSFSLEAGGKVGHNWQTPMFGWGQYGLGIYQIGGIKQTPNYYDWNNPPIGTGPQLPNTNPNQVPQPDPMQDQTVQSRKFGVGQLPNPYGNQQGLPFFSGNYYLDRSIYTGQRAQQFRDQATANEAAGDPIAARLDRRAATGNSIISGTSGAQAVMTGVQNTAGILSDLFSTGQARKLEAEQFYNNNRRDRALVNPYQGDNTAPAFSKHGGYVIPYGTHEFGYGGKYQMGGIPMDGSDFKTGNANVVTEIGETITDPTKGPMGPNGMPTGVVVHDKTGDEHSDPSGGNAYELGEGSVVHSKVLGIKVGDFLEKLTGKKNLAAYGKKVKYQTGGEVPTMQPSNLSDPIAYMTGKILEKYPNPDKEVSFAQLAGVFDTKELAKEIERMTKKGENIDKKSLGTQATTITQTTQNLNKQTLSKKLAMKTQEMALNAAITGSNGAIHNVSEDLKGSGAYGATVKKEKQQADRGNPPTVASKGISMKGKKVLLPKAQTGTRVYRGRRAASKEFFDPAQIPFDPNAPAIQNQGLTYYDPNAGVVPTTTTTPNGQMTTTTTPVVQPAQTTLPTLPTLPVTAKTPSAVSQAPVDQSQYSQLPTPYSINTGINQTNLNKLYQQYGQRGKADPNWYTNFAAAAEKGEVRIPETVGDWNAFGQKKRPDGTYGPVTAADIIEQEKQPGMSFMKNIANKYGLAHFDPANAEYVKDPVTGQMGTKGQLMLRDYEEAVNKAYETQGMGPFFTKDNTQPFGNKLYGAWHASVAPWIHRSEGGAKSEETNDPDVPVIYSQTSDKAPVQEEDKKPARVPKAGVRGGLGDRKLIYREGLAPEQIAGEIAGLFIGRDAVPYIEDQGAKDALAASTRQQFTNDWAARNAILRQQKALTQYQPQNNQPFNAQVAADAWTANNELSAQTAASNAQIQQRYEDMQNALRQKAGANKAEALDTLAQRTATARWKKTALDINSISGIAMKRLQNRLENRTGVTYQGMFKNAGWDPHTGAYIGNTTGFTPVVGGPDMATQLLSQGYSPLDVYRIQRGMEIGQRGEMERERGELYSRQGYSTKKYGGKLKRIKKSK